MFSHQEAWLNFVRTILFSERIYADAACHFLMWSGVFVRGGRASLGTVQKHNFRTLLRFWWNWVVFNGRLPPRRFLWCGPVALLQLSVPDEGRDG